MASQSRDADSDEAERTGAVGKGAVEQPAGQLSDLIRIVDADA